MKIRADKEVMHLVTEVTGGSMAQWFARWTVTREVGVRSPVIPSDFSETLSVFPTQLELYW